MCDGDICQSDGSHPLLILVDCETSGLSIYAETSEPKYYPLQYLSVSLHFAALYGLDKQSLPRGEKTY